MSLLEYYYNKCFIACASPQNEEVMNEKLDDDELFEAAYFSFLIVAKFKPRHDILSRFVCSYFKYTIDFMSVELWLQRKALVVFLKEFCASYILDNSDYIRLEIICYALLQVELSKGDLKRLQKEYKGSEVDELIERLLIA